MKLNLGMIYLLSLTLLFFTGCGKSGKIEGYVYDENGNPMGGVLVKVNKSRFAATTDATGFYSLDFVPGKIEVTSVKEGYLSDVISIDVNDSSDFRAPEMSLHNCRSNKTPEQLAKSLLQTMVKNDLTAFKHYLLIPKELLIADIEKSTPEEMKDSVLKSVNQKFIAKYQPESSKDWHRCYQAVDEGEDESIWPSMISKKIESEIEKNEIGLTTARIEIEFEHITRTSLGFFFMFEAVLLDENWYYMDRLKIL